MRFGSSLDSQSIRQPPHDLACGRLSSLQQVSELEALTAQLRSSTQQAEEEATRLRAESAERGRREAEAAAAAAAARAEAEAAEADAARRVDDAHVAAEGHVAVAAKMRAAMEADEAAKLAAQREADELRTAFAEAQHTVRICDAALVGWTLDAIHSEGA